MTVEIAEDALALEVAAGAVLFGEVLWHIAADHLSDEDLAAEARSWARQAVEIDATDGRPESSTGRLAALLRAMAEQLEAVAAAREVVE